MINEGLKYGSPPPDEPQKAIPEHDEIKVLDEAHRRDPEGKPGAEDEPVTGPSPQEDG